jgi:hypothetical protein
MTPHTPRRQVFISFIATNSLSLALIAMALLLIGQAVHLHNVNLSYRLELAAADRMARLDDPIRPNDTVASVAGVDNTGRRHFIATRDETIAGSLLFTLGRRCPTCAAVLTRSTPLVQLAEAHGVQVLRIYRDPSISETSDRGLTIAAPSYRTWVQLNLNRIPQVMLVSRNGVVTAASAGPLTTTTLTMFREAVLRLPRPSALSSEPAATSRR